MDAEDTEEALQVEIVPHFDHIHAVFGDALDEKEIMSQHEVWSKVWTRKAMRAVEEVSITPYIVRSNLDDDDRIWIQTVDAMKDIQNHFNKWKECK